MAGKKRFWVMLTVIAALCMFAATGMAADKVLKVGVMGPFTGPSAKSGKEFKDSVTMALEKVGGKVGDYKIEVVWVDSQSDPAKATNAFAEACERKGIQAGSLNWHSSVAAACMDMAAQYKVPWFFAMGAAEIVNKKWRDNPKKYNYWGGKGWPTPSKLDAGIVDFLEAMIKDGKFKPKAKKAAIFGEDTDWGRNSGTAVKAALKKAGWEIASEDYFALTQTDFYPLISKWKKAGVTFVGGTTTSAASMTNLVKQYGEVGMKKQALMFANGLAWVGDWYKLVGTASDGVVDMQAQWASAAAKKFAADKKKKFGYEPSAPASGLSYDGFNFFLKLLKRTLEKEGKLNAKTIHKIMVEEVNTGKLTYTAKDGAILMKEYKYTAKTMPDAVVGPDYYFFPVVQYSGGKGNAVFPASMKTKDFAMPK